MTGFARSRPPVGWSQRSSSRSISIWLLLALAGLLAVCCVAATAASTDLAVLDYSSFHNYVSNPDSPGGDASLMPIPAGWHIDPSTYPEVFVGGKYNQYRFDSRWFEDVENNLTISGLRGTQAFKAWCDLPALNPTAQHWALDMDLYVLDIMNYSVSSNGTTPHCQADPNITVTDSAGNPLVKLGWKVTDDPNPNNVKCELLVNDTLPLVPTRFGMIPTGIPSTTDGRGTVSYSYVPNYDPGIAGFDHPIYGTNHRHFSLTLLGDGVTGKVSVVLRYTDETGAVRTKSVTAAPLAGNVMQPATIHFNVGGMQHPDGGSSFRLLDRPQGTLLLVTDQMVANDEEYLGTVNTRLSVGTPGVLSNDIDGCGVAPRAELVMDARHGLINLNPDGSFTYDPDPGFYGKDTFTYHVVDGAYVSNEATVTINVPSPYHIDLAANIDLANMHRYYLDSMPPADWQGTPNTAPPIDLWNWYGWGTYTDTMLHSLNMMSTAFPGTPGGFGVVTTFDPLTVWHTMNLDPGDPITGWALSTKMYVNNIVNTAIAPGHVAADPYFAFEDASGHPITKLEWRVTDNADPALTTNELLINGMPLIPPVYGVKPTGFFTNLKTSAGYNSDIVGFGDHTGKSFDLLLSTGADGHTIARLNGTLTSGEQYGPSLGAGDAAHPARLAFYCGNGLSPIGGGNFQFFQQANGTLNFYYTHALPQTDFYQTSMNTSLTVPAPGVMGNDLNPDNCSSLTAEVATQAAHGWVALNPDGSFTYYTWGDYTGMDSFTYHLVDGGLAITSAATVYVWVRPLSRVSLQDAAITPGTRLVQVPVMLEALGDENTLGCTVNYDPSLLMNPTVVLGTDVLPGGVLMTNESETAWGHLGLGVAQPFGAAFAPGTRQVAVINFTVVPHPAADTTAVSFTNSPVNNELVDVWADAVGAEWQGGLLTINHPPVTQDDSYVVNQNTMLQVGIPGVLANDYDPDWDTLTASLVSAPSNGTLRLHADGSFSYTPRHGFVGSDLFIYQASDGTDLSNLAIVTLTVLPTGYEADVAPRGDGDGRVAVTDWVQVGRFVAGLDTPATPSEYQHADCAPRSSKGDGTLTISDWVQAGRYAIGLDPLTPVGGPTAPAGTAAAMRSHAAGKAATSRTISLAAPALTRGKAGVVQVVLNAQGNENALGFTLNFNAKQLKFVGAKLVGAANGATLNVNAKQAANGSIGLALMLPLPKTVKAGKQALLELTFQPLAYGLAPVTFGDQVVGREVAGAAANTLPAIFANGTVMIRK